MNIRSKELLDVSGQPSDSTTYDSNSKVLLLNDGSKMLFYDPSSESVVSSTVIYNPTLKSAEPSQPSQETKQNNINTSTLRFTPLNAQSKLAISPSGLVVTALSTNEEIAICNMGFTSGTHYWEIICPRSCNNIQIGIIREGWSISNPTTNNSLHQLVQFRTSTPRVVGLRLDLNKGELYFWLNGIFQNQRTIKKLPSGTWYPCVKLKEVGTHIVLNPYATDPEYNKIYNPYTKNSLAEIKLKLAQTVVVGGITKVEKSSLSKLEQSLDFASGTLVPTQTMLDETGTIVCFVFSNPQQAEEFSKLNTNKQYNGKNIIIVDNLKLVSEFVEIHKSGKDVPSYFQHKPNADVFTAIFSWVERNLNKLSLQRDQDNKDIIELAELLSKVKKGLTLDSQISACKYEDLAGKAVKSVYIQKSDVLLLAHENKLKLLKKEDSTIQGLNSLFVNKPRYPSDEITLRIPKAKLLSFLSRLERNDLEKICEQKGISISLKIFLESLQTSLEKDFEEENINIIIVYKHAKRIISYFIGSLYSSLKWLNEMIRGTVDFLEGRSQQKNSSSPTIEDEILPLFDVLKPNANVDEIKNERMTREKATLLFKNLTLNDLYDLLSFLLRIDETLYAMTLHSSASKKLKRYWPSSSPRLFSAFSRLGSLMSFPSNRDPVAIAEAGLYNTQDLIFDIKHFLDPEKILEEIQNLRGDDNLWETLQKMLPENRMVLGLPSGNVPLSVTLNHIPYVEHSENPETNILEIASNPSTSLVTTISNDGLVQLWNTELALVSMGQTNFRQESKCSRPSIQKKPDSEDNFIAGLELDELKNEEVQITPDPGMTETLYNMGFPLELAKKALILTKNAGVAAALDKILLLQEEEKTTTKNETKLNTSRIKPEWDCPACTFVNTNANSFCEVCGTEAPMDAYYNEDEVTIEEDKNEETAQKQIPSEKSFLESANIHSHFLISFESSLMSPLIVGVVFEEEKDIAGKYQVRFRRFSYNSSYLKQFYHHDQNKGYSSLLSGTHFNDIKALHNHLAVEYGLTFRALEPIFIGNMKYTDLKKDGKSHLFCDYMVLYDEFDLKLENPLGKLLKIIQTTHINKENQKESCQLYFVWQNGQDIILQNYEVKNLCVDPYSFTEEKTFEVSEISQNKLGLNGKFLDAVIIEGDLIIITEIQYSVFKLENLDAPTYTHTFEVPIPRAKIHSRNLLTAELSNSKIQLLSVTQNETTEKRSEQSSLVLNADVPPVEKLTETQVNSIKDVLKKSPVRGIAKINDKIDSLENVRPSLFVLPVNQQNATKSDVLEIEFSHPHSLISIEVNAYFDRKADSHFIQTEDEVNFIQNLKRGSESIPKEADQNLVEEQSHTKKSTLPILSITEAESSNKLLPLTVYSFKGASYHEKFPVSKLTSPNNEVFCTNYSDSEFIFQHLHEKIMLIKSVTVHSKFKPLGSYGYPIGSGLIFTSMHLSDFSTTSRFSEMKHQDFNKWYKERIQQNSELEPWEPVGSFEFDEKSESLTVDLKYTRACKYILLKPTSMRSKPENYTSYFKGSPIEIRFFGASGTIIEQEPSSILPEKKPAILNFKDAEITVEGCNANNEWIKIQYLNDITLQTLADQKKSSILSKYWDTVNSLPISARSIFEIYNEAIFQQGITKLRITARNLPNKDAQWSLSRISVQALASPPNITSRLGFSPVKVRNMLLNPQEFEKFNLALAQEVVKEEITYQRRKNLLSLISSLSTVDSNLATLFYKNIDMKKFIWSVVLQERNAAFIDIQNLLRIFSSNEDFAQTLLTNLLEILPRLTEAKKINPIGLNGFFGLLAWCQSLDTSKVYENILNQLRKISHKIRSIRPSEYNILRAQYNIQGLVLEKELFSEGNLERKLKKKGKDGSEKKKNLNLIKCKYAASFSQDADEYLVDLGSIHNLKEIRLSFEQNTKVLRFKVQIWAMTNQPTGKKLIHSKLYPESTWIQLTNYAYDKINNDNVFKPSEELECLGFSNLNVECRYLIIQITYALLPIIQPPADKNEKKVIPEFYGELKQENGGEIEGFQKIFKNAHTNPKEKIKGAHTISYEKFEITDKSLPFRYIFDASISQGNKKSAALINEETARVEKLQNLQNSLIDKLNHYRNPENIHQNKEEIMDLCDEIEGIQFALLSIRNEKEDYSINAAESLDFMYSLAIKLSQILRKLDASTEASLRTWRNNQDFKGDIGREIALEIFENFVVFETGNSQEFVSLLAEVLVNNLEKNQSREFVFSAINKFLSSPINFATSPLSSIFSHGRTIEALDKIYVPCRELLSYLVQKLKISGEEKIAEGLESKQDNNSILCMLSSTLILLNNGFKKIQISEKDESPQKSAIQIKEGFEVKELSFEESLQAMFNLCVWICESQKFNDIDKSSLLSLGLDIIFQIMRFCKVSGVRDLLKDPNGFLKLFMSTMKMGSSNLLAKLKLLLDAFLNPKSKAKEKQNQEDEDAVAEESKILLIHHLQSILKWLITYAIDPEHSSTFPIVVNEELSPTIWMEHMCFILDFLLIAADKIPESKSKEPKKAIERKKSTIREEKEPIKEEPIKPGFVKSYSFTTDDRAINIEGFEKSSAIPIELIVNLIYLLAPHESGRPGFDFTGSTKAWSLIMKAILKIKMTSLIEAKVFDHLITSFLSANEDIQQTMFPEIITLTQNMVTHQSYQKELCNAVLSVIFSILGGLSNDKYEPIAFSLLKGWLDILLTKNSPKPDNFYTKLEPAYCKLNAQGALTLLVNLSSFFWRQLNFGSKDGVLCSSEVDVLKLQIADDLLRLLITADSAYSLLALSELFSNFKKYSKEIGKAMELFVSWFLLNRSTDSSPSPSTDLLKSISDNLMKLFQIVADYPEVTKVSISALLSACKKIDYKLLSLNATQRISSYSALQYNSRTCKILEELFDLWVTTDIIASYVAFEINGFEYLLDRMGLALADISSKAKQSNQASLVSMLQGTDLPDYMNKSKEDTKDQTSMIPSEFTALENSTNNEDPKEEEFANKLTLVNQPGQTWSGITPDWSTNKKGVRARILFFIMNGNFYNEYTLVFTLDKTVELKSIKIGFNTVWTDYSDKVLGVPSSVLVEGGTSINDLSPIATLQPINDEGYTNFSVKVFQKNFQRINTGNKKTIENCLESLGTKRVSVLKFRFRRPTVTFVEGLSMLANKTYKNVAVSISFISISGYDVKKLPNTRKKLVEAQESSTLQVIGKLCSQQFVETLGVLANEQEVVRKIKSSFDTLSSLLVHHESWLAPVFMAIASHNQEMGDWIISKFLDTNKSKEHAKLVGEIVLSNPNFIYSRIKTLNNFVLSEVKTITSQQKHDNAAKFNSLIPFMEALSNTIRSVPTDLIEKSLDNPIELEFTKEDLNLILSSFENYNSASNNRVMIKLILVYLYLPAPFAIKEEGLLRYTLDKIWELITSQQKTLYYEMLGPIIVGSTASAKWFMAHIDEVLSDVLKKLEECSASNLKTLRHSFVLLTSLSRNEQIKRKITSQGWHLKLYEELKSKDSKSKTVLKEIDIDIVQLAVDFLKNLCVGVTELEEELAKVLKKDLSLIESKRDIAFVNNVFIPLLNAEFNIPVCLNPFDTVSNRIITDGRRLTSSTSPTTEKQEFISTPLLNKHQTETLVNTLQKLTKATGLSRKMKNVSWQKVITSQVDGENILVDIRQKLSKQGPFMILLEGTNAGKRCVVGIFSSQNMAELPEQFDTSLDQSYSIPMADDNFIFYYEDDFNLHFTIPSSPNQTAFAKLHTFYDGGGGLSVYYYNTERIFISFAPSQTSFVDINLADMDPLDDDKKQSYPPEIPLEFVFKSAEYWVLKTSSSPSQTSQQEKKNQNSVLNNVLFQAWYNNNQPLNYYRPNPVYNVPAFITVQKLADIVLGNPDLTLRSRLTRETLDPKTTISEFYEFIMNDPSSNGIIDLEFDARAFLEKQAQKKESQEGEVLKYKAAMKVFESFEKHGGVERIIEVALKSLTHWKDKDKSKRWFTWLQEVSSFAYLPNFFGLFLKNKETMDLLFQLVIGAPDQEKIEAKKKWDEEEQKAVKFTYQILADVFAVDTEIKLREFAIQHNLFARILDRIAMISKEYKRRWVENIDKEEEEEVSDQSGTKKEEEDDVKKKVTKKKGVGYASDNTGQNQKWNVNEYVESKKAKNEQLVGMIEIIHNFINVKEWTPGKKILDDICSSALLPLLESAFRSASLLDMAKESELNHAYLKLTRAIAHHKSLLSCLLDLDKHYQPPQKDSIYKLLANLKDLAQIFLNCLTAADKDASAPNQKLAQDIIDTYHLVDTAIKTSHDFEQDDEGEMLDILAQPLPVAYRTLLKDLRFDYVSMKDPATGKFKHHYTSYITGNNPPQQKMVRLAQELADLSTALPIEHTNSIFVRVDDSRVDVMKALIMGSAGTPYAHGAFEYDIFFDDSYPNAPPKVNLTTTGSGKVRFNPNLYACGKVCLSLLGTWRGNASENWDPKLSTLLQVLVSIQAIIMSEEIYFNEPGFEGEAGTEEGERKNEAYSNIVRYCNIKYAMIEQIRNPPKGFETVIKRHFYLKKNEILEECRKWIKYAEAREASYNGLVNDHNHTWCAEFKSSKTRYRDMLTEAVKELEAELNKLSAPSGKELQQKVFKKKKEKKVEKTDIKTGIANIEDIDVSYDKEVKTKEMNIEDEGVKDRWSRYIGAMGVDAVAKQSSASIFLSGLGALGVEIAKNIVLSGVKRFTIHDSENTTYRDLSGQFFLGEEDIGKNRAEASLPKIQQLNYYVKVDSALLGSKLPVEESEIDKLLKGYTMVILTECDQKVQIAFNNYCRKNKIFFISTDQYGPFSRVFTDFGDEFVVLDKNGEELQEVMIGNITNEENGVVTLLAGHKHKFEDGDEIIIHGVEGMEAQDKTQVEISKDKPASINGTRHKIKVINASSFKIGDTRNYTPYIRNGLAKQLKQAIPLKFEPLQSSLTKKIPFDPNMLVHDFLKINHPNILHCAFGALDEFVKKNNRRPKPWDLQDAQDFLAIAYEVAKSIDDFNPQDDKKFEKIIRIFSFTCQGVFSPLAAFMGGYVAQEAIKGITQKFMPTKQFFYTDCIEVVPDLPESKEELAAAIKTLGVEEKKHRSDGLRIIVGEKLLTDLAYANLFMVGAGAIGCELLKNYAMLGVGTGEAGKNQKTEGGKIILTDPDVIEVSNLNRQFLFREKHLRKPKSQTAAAAALQMNKELKGHIIARLDKVHEGTAHIFTDKFFEDLTVVTNALDNVQARRYIDSRCVSAKTPLLESGTLGPKGHVQVIVPFKTESYSSQQDPQEEGEIPHCTLKMFPEETLHCVEWARDKFGKIFTQRPKALMKIIEDPKFQVTGSQELKTLREAVTLLKKKPLNFDDCIRYARYKFQKYFVNDIRQLLFTYPLDAKTKEGRPFWSLPKRPPTEVTFDPKNPLHASFIAACACLRAKVFNIPIPNDARKESGKLRMAEEAAKIKVPDFQPSAEKAKEIASEVDKTDKGNEEIKEEDDAPTQMNEGDVLLQELNKYVKELPKKDGKIMCCVPEEFEKDDDTNFHIDFIYSIANCRSSNYKLEPMDWMTVKIKAGRIIPALATTTASIAGLQTIELCKLLRNCKIEDMKNAFLNLAVPILALSEPGPAPVTKLTSKLQVNIWDRWDVKLPRDAKLKDLFEVLTKTYELRPRDVTYGSQPIYLHALMEMSGKEKEREAKENAKLVDLLELEKDEKYADLNVMFTRFNENELLKGVPTVRVDLE